MVEETDVAAWEKGEALPKDMLAAIAAALDQPILAFFQIMPNLLYNILINLFLVSSPIVLLYTLYFICVGHFVYAMSIFVVSLLLWCLVLLFASVLLDTLRLIMSLADLCYIRVCTVKQTGKSEHSFRAE
jgi:hypothetical protein